MDPKDLPASDDGRKETLEQALELPPLAASGLAINAKRPGTLSFSIQPSDGTGQPNWHAYLLVKRNGLSERRADAAPGATLPDVADFGAGVSLAVVLVASTRRDLQPQSVKVTAEWEEDSFRRPLTPGWLLECDLHTDVDGDGEKEVVVQEKQGRGFGPTVPKEGSAVSEGPRGIGGIAMPVAAALALCLAIEGAAAADQSATDQAYLAVLGGRWTAAKEHYRLGQLAFDHEQWAEAAGHFEAFARAEPAGPYADNALWLGSRCYERLGNPRGERRLLDILCSQYALSCFLDGALMRVAALLRTEGDRGAAVQAYQQVAADCPDSDLCDDAAWESAWTLVEMQQTAQVREAFLRLARTWPQSPFVEQALLEAAQSLGALGEPERAAQELARFAAEHGRCRPKAADALLRAGFLCRHAGDPQAAADYFDQVRQRFPTSEQAPRATFHEAECLQRMGALQDAEDLFLLIADRWAASDFADDALLAGSDCARQLGDRQRAVRCLQGLIEDYPGSDIAEQALTRLHDLGRAPRNVRRDLGWARHRFDEAFALVRDGRNEQALAALDDLLRATGDTHHDFADNALWEAGLACQRSNRFADAIAYYKQVLDRCPGSDLRPVALLHIGESLSRSGQTAGALEAYEAVLTDYPDSGPVVDALRSVADVYRGEHDWTKAIQAYRRLAKDGGYAFCGPEAAYQEAWCTRDAGNNDAALDLFLRVANDYPPHDLGDTALFEAAQTAAMIGKPAELGSRAEEPLRRELLRRYPHSQLAENTAYGLARMGMATRQWQKCINDSVAAIAEYPLTEHWDIPNFQAAQSAVELKDRDTACRLLEAGLGGTVTPRWAAVMADGLRWIREGPGAFPCIRAENLDVDCPAWFADEKSEGQEAAVLEACWQVLTELVGRPLGGASPGR